MTENSNPIPVGHVEPSDVAKAVLFFAAIQRPAFVSRWARVRNVACSLC